MIRQLEKAIVEHAFAQGWILPEAPQVRTGKRVIVIGGGPAGLSAAVGLNRLGHRVTVYEKNIFCGGLLRYGIPDFKLDKKVIERRMKILKRVGN